ncbi:MAG TPA: hypothetical protein O0X70_05930, partial [Methanocorpusculum sp.]|nr:hypothetical protein [Methanocorpusculum sp.]
MADDTTNNNPDAGNSQTNPPGINAVSSETVPIQEEEWEAVSEEEGEEEEWESIEDEEEFEEEGSDDSDAGSTQVISEEIPEPAAETEPAEQLSEEITEPVEEPAVET